MAITLGTFTKLDSGAFTGTLKTLNVTASLTIAPSTRCPTTRPITGSIPDSVTRSVPAGPGREIQRRDYLGPAAAKADRPLLRCCPSMSEPPIVRTHDRPWAHYGIFCRPERRKAGGLTGKIVRSVEV